VSDLGPSRQERNIDMTPEQASVYLTHLMDFNVVPIVTWSYDGAILSANDAFLKLIGYSPGDLKADKINWKALTPPEYLSLDERCMRQLESAPIADPYVKEYVRRDGTRVAVKLFNGRDMRVPREGVAIIIGI
jgi:PAS domain S-box-containing protein